MGGSPRAVSLRSGESQPRPTSTWRRTERACVNCHRRHGAESIIHCGNRTTPLYVRALFADSHANAPLESRVGQPGIYDEWITYAYLQQRHLTSSFFNFSDIKYSRDTDWNLISHLRCSQTSHYCQFAFEKDFFFISRSYTKITNFKGFWAPHIRYLEVKDAFLKKFALN